MLCRMQTILAASTLAGLALAAAVPTRVEKRQGSTTTWINPAAETSNGNVGNTKVQFSDAVLNYGTVAPWELISQNLSVICTDDGDCTANAQSQSLGTTAIVLADQTVNVEDISVIPDGQYAPWLHNGFFDFLTEAMANQTTNNTITIFCDGQAEYCGPAGTYMQYTAPAYISITYLGDTSTSNDIELTFSVTDPGSGFCSTIAAVGGALAGLISEAPELSSAFELGSVLCTL